MNIYEKLQACKSELQSMNLPKTGKNKFAGYDYWELSDFLPTVISLFKQHGICSFVSFSSDVATLTVVSIEKPEESISVTSPMAAADLKGCHAIQNMGAVETYQRRYLYQSLLDISEPDALDGTMSSDHPSTDSKPAPTPDHKIRMTPAQAVTEINTLMLQKFGASAPDTVFAVTGYKNADEIPVKELGPALKKVKAACAE